MTNLLYRCALFELVGTYQAEPREVLLRLYGPTHSDTDIQLEIFNQLASENLGPNLYATFDGGRLEEYLPSHPLTWIELTDDEISAVVARKIAAIHKLNVQSLARKCDWLINKYNQYNDFLEKTVKRGVPKFSEHTLVLTKDIALFMIEIDFKPEIEYMSALFENSRAPLVFSHNDLHQNNILLKESDKDQNLYDRIVLIDFEYCSYNYRSFDIANHLSEWCFDYSTEEYPYFSYSAERFPTEENQRRFLANYVNELSDIDFERGKETSNSDEEKLDAFDKTDILLEEMQPFFMASNLLWALWAIHSAYTSKIKFGYWVSMATQYRWLISAQRNQF